MITLEKIGFSPVKGFQLQYLPSAYLTTHGLEWDRDFFIFDEEGKAILHGISSFLPIKAEYDPELDTLSFTFPDGYVISGSAKPQGDPFVYDHLTIRDIDLIWLDNELDEAMSDRTGETVRFARVAETGQGVDVYAVSMVSFESVADLSARAGKELEPGRFRSTFEISGVDEPYAEESWTGRHMRVGEVEIEILTSVPRCAITTLNSVSGKRDHNVVRTLSKFREHVGLPEPYPSFAAAPMAVYAHVLVPGRITVGDELVFLD